GENFAIGRNLCLPWHLPEDTKWFCNQTRHHVVVMGHKTLLALPDQHPLPRRQNIVISHDKPFVHDPLLHWTGSIEDAKILAEKLALEIGQPEIFVIGGGEIYRQFMPIASRMYLTWVHASPQADVFFPQFDQTAWHKKKLQAYPAQNGQPAFTITRYDRP